MLVNIEGEEKDHISGGCRETPQGGRVDLGCSVTAGPAAATCTFCGRRLARRERRICRRCAALFPFIVEAEHPHREGRLEYKYHEGKRSEEDAYS